jgi:hypothetical protein
MEIYSSHSLIPASPKDFCILAIKDVLSLIPYVPQVVWADLYFCSSLSKAHSLSRKEPYSTSIAKSECTVRVADNSFFFIYTQSPDLVDKVLLSYKQAKVTQKKLTEFIFMH